MKIKFYKYFNVDINIKTFCTQMKIELYLILKSELNVKLSQNVFKKYSIVARTIDQSKAECDEK